MLSTCPQCGAALPAPGVRCPAHRRHRTVDGGGAAAVADAPVEPTLTRDPLVGRELGDYRVDERIGVGGMGIVYAGTHRLIGKRVAIKVLRPELARDPAQLQRILGEARAAAQLNHRCIVDVFGFGATPDGRDYLVMERLEGEPVDQLLGERGALPLEDAAAILDDVLAALCAAHARGVIHRDLKPSNLIRVRDADGAHCVKVLDFGLATVGAVRTDADAGPGRVAGTPAYMSPEQAQGLPLDPRSDLYSLGVLAFELVTGRVPFDGATGPEVVRQHVQSPPPHPRAHRPDLPPALDALIVRLLSKARADRPASADEARRELGRVRRSLPRPAVARTTETEAPPASAKAEGPTLEELALAQRALAVAAPARQGLGSWVLSAAAAGILALVVLLVGPAWFGQKGGPPGDEGASAPPARTGLQRPETAGGGFGFGEEDEAEPVSRDALGWRVDDLLDRARRRQVDARAVQGLDVLRRRLDGAADAELPELERAIGRWETQYLSP